MAFEIAKLDDIIYLQYEYKNTEVIKAFEKYNLLARHAPGATMVTRPGSV